MEVKWGFMPLRYKGRKQAQEAKHCGTNTFRATATCSTTMNLVLRCITSEWLDNGSVHYYCVRWIQLAQSRGWNCTIHEYAITTKLFSKHQHLQVLPIMIITLQWDKNTCTLSTHFFNSFNFSTYFCNFWLYTIHYFWNVVELLQVHFLFRIMLAEDVSESVETKD